MSDRDTICAVSTPPGEGGIGIIRVSGVNAISVTAALFKTRTAKNLESEKSHTIHYGNVVDPQNGEIIDEVLVTLMRGPSTYTREDVVEINCHGGMAPLSRTINLLILSGARLAEPGEFTKRAFLNGRLDLAQAEAVMDVIRARTDLSLKAANEVLQGGLSAEIGRLRSSLISLMASVEAGIDFPEEDIETETGQPLAEEIYELIERIESMISGASFGRIYREGFATAIIGRPNVGKSSLLNALLKQDRAIVTEIAGTTRDVLEEYVNIGGVPLKILDTAGIRQSSDIVEQEGVRRTLAAIEAADLVLVVLDGSQPLTSEDRRALGEVKEKKSIAVINKSDLPENLEAIDHPVIQVKVSCRTGEGLPCLRETIAGIVKAGTLVSGEHRWAVNERHKRALEKSKESLLKALESVKTNLSPEFTAVDLRDALDNVGLIIGATYTDDILEKIFSDFCIGK